MKNLIFGFEKTVVPAVRYDFPFSYQFESSGFNIDLFWFIMILCFMAEIASLELDG